MVCILLVEDDIQFNRIVCSYLTDNGYNVVGCLSAAEAFEQMEKMSFDMIVSDIMMKDVNGFEFAEQVRIINKDIPFLFLTARDDLQSKEKGYRMGIDDYIVKPFEPLEVIARINAHLRREENKEQNKENEQSQGDELKTVKVREIWVGNLPIGITEATLHKTFFIYGEITKIEIHNEKCFAFIRYKLCASASKAYEKTKNMNLLNRPIRVSFSDSGKRRDIIGDEPGYELTEKTCRLVHVSLNKSQEPANEQTSKDVFSK